MKFSTYLTRLIAQMKRERKINPTDYWICNNIESLIRRAPLSQLGSYKGHSQTLLDIVRSKIQREDTKLDGRGTFTYILPPEPGKDKAEWGSRITWLTTLRDLHKKKGN